MNDTPIGVAPAGGMIWDPETNSWVPYASMRKAPGTHKYGGETVAAEETAYFTPGEQNYAGMAVKSLKSVEVKATTKIAPEDAKFNNLDIAGDAVFHGKVSFASAVHTKWFDASKGAGVNIIIDLANGPNQYVILGEDKNIWIPSKVEGELMFSILIIQDSTGDWTPTWMINGGDQDVDGWPIVYWPGGEEPIMSPTAGAADMYSLTWMAYLNAGKGAYVGMMTQDMRVPAVE
jgi:hypothetical protein